MGPIACLISTETLGVGDVGLLLPDLLMTLELRRGVEPITPQRPQLRDVGGGGGEGSQWEQWAAAAR